MKPLLLLGVWLALGVAVAWRRPLPAGDRVLATLFWPFFLGSPDPGATSPTGRLAALLHARDQPALAQRLLAEEARLRASITRLQAAERELQGPGGALVRAALATARDSVRKLDALSDETRARLVIAAESGSSQAVLADLQAHLAALAEVEPGQE